MLMAARPVTYLITFACYGAHMHGDETGSVDRTHNLPGSKLLPSQPGRLKAERALMDQPPYVLDARRREIVLASIRRVSLHRKWLLLAAHVRTNHVHAVVDAGVQPERVMNDFKAYASRELNRLESSTRKRWARQGSTRWLREGEDVRGAIQYVVERQGEPMAVFAADVR